ncbi:MAG: hypothetical protein JXN59_00010 [Anaerolineae bacterium]|nr:hypothetical protein [Anaerolineae bacterium]
MPALTGDRPVMASGTVTLSMIVNLKRFIQRDTAPGERWSDLFEQVRGTAALDTALRALPRRMGGPFVPDEAENALLDAAHRMRVLRGYVRTQYLYPTYRLDEDAFIRQPTCLGDDPVLVESFPDWDYQITLTRNGFAIVRMCRTFTDQPLSQIASAIQQVESERTGAGNYVESRSSWRIAMDVTAVFLEALGGALAVTDSHGARLTIPFDPEQRRGRLPLHDRYTTIQLARVYRDGQEIDPDAFVAEYGSYALGMMRLATVLHGGAAADMRRRRVVSADDLLNLSPWTQDLCLISNDAMLVYSQAPPDAAASHAGTDHAYTHPLFWQGVARVVEWLVNLKTEWQLIERQSTELLETISNLTARVNDGLLDAEDEARLRALAAGVSRAFNILPEARYGLVPSSLTHATDAARVFAHVLDQLGVRRVADHVNANMAELSSFLSYYSSTQLQFESQQREETESRTGLSISIMLILLSLVSVPSLIKDASEINWATVLAEPPWQLASVVVLALLPIILLVVAGLYALRRLRD